MAVFNTFLTCKLAILSRRLSWEQIKRIPETVTREPEVEAAENLIAWREGLRMSFTESTWHRSISDLTLRPLCAVAEPQTSSEFPPLIAVISVIPELTSSITATLSTVLSEICEEKVDLIPSAIKLGTFLANEYERRNLRLTSLRALDVKGESGMESEWRLILPHGKFEFESTDRLPFPPKKLLRDWEKTLDSDETFAANGISDVGFQWESATYVVNRDSTVQLGTSYSSMPEVSQTLSQLIHLIKEYVVPLPGNKL